MREKIEESISAKGESPMCGPVKDSTLGSELKSFTAPTDRSVFTESSLGLRPKSYEEASEMRARSRISLASRCCSAMDRRDLAMSEYCIACVSSPAKNSRAEMDLRTYLSKMLPKPARSPAPMTRAEANSHELTG